jgi:hypothetical protein
MRSTFYQLIYTVGFRTSSDDAIPFLLTKILPFRRSTGPLVSRTATNQTILARRAYGIVQKVNHPRRNEASIPSEHRVPHPRRHTENIWQKPNRVCQFSCGPRGQRAACVVDDQILHWSVSAGAGAGSSFIPAIAAPDKRQVLRLIMGDRDRNSRSSSTPTKFSRSFASRCDPARAQYGITSAEI